MKNKDTTPKIKPIETEYKGYRFRSRLEARWAIFFDALHLQWVYEDEGFQFDRIPVRITTDWEKISGKYLPDFYFPKLNYYIEIKGRPATNFETLLCAALSSITDSKVYLFDSGMFLPGSSGFDYDAPFCSRFIRGEFSDSPLMWMKCDKCGKIDITFDGWVHYSSQCKCYDDVNRKKWGGSNHPDIVAAYTKALSSRFEYGEHP